MFDLHGFIVIKNAVPQDEIKRMLELCDYWQSLPEDELPAPLKSYIPPGGLKPHGGAHHSEPDKVFQSLALNPQIMKCVLAFTLKLPQLLDIDLIRNFQQSDDLPFHGSVVDFPLGLHHPPARIRLQTELSLPTLQTSQDN